MIVLSYGMTKSGSTLAFELCKAILEKRGFAQRRLPDEVVTPGHHINFLQEVSVVGLQALLKEVAQGEFVAIKLHTGLRQPEADFIGQQISAGTIKLHVNFRDPREVCLSLVDAGAKAREKQRQAFSEIVTLSDAANAVKRQLNICRRWGSIEGALPLFYNQVAFETGAAIERICADFGFPMFDQPTCAELMAPLFGETFTQKNKAVKDRYKDDLTVRQNEMLLDQIPGVRPFINRVCEQGDYSWFSQIRRGATEEVV